MADAFARALNCSKAVCMLVNAMTLFSRPFQAHLYPAQIHLPLGHRLLPAVLRLIACARIYAAQVQQCAAGSAILLSTLGVDALQPIAKA